MEITVDPYYPPTIPTEEKRNMSAQVTTYVPPPRSIVWGVFWGMWLFVISAAVLPIFLFAMAALMGLSNYRGLI